MRAEVKVGNSVRSFQSSTPQGDALEIKRLTKRFLKLALYDSLASYCGVGLPWGSLTGIRPTKLAYDYFSSGGSADSIAEYLTNAFRVSEKKANTIQKIINVQSKYVHDIKNGVNLYVHVPFCDGRCYYCSFPSADVNKNSAYLAPYVTKLAEEIREVVKLIKEQGKRILSIYVGGGTPSVLDAKMIAELLTAIDSNGVEFTFEAGRPDSITAEKLSVLKEYGVTRVCVNPQTLNNETLARIGRKHTAEMFYNVYESAKSYGFDLNTDIIAGLDGESVDEFKRTIDQIASLRPENVTVHTLSRKRGSVIAENDLKIFCADIAQMTDYAYEIFSSDYNPYYLYRQKYMVGNLENIGFSLPCKECVNNITVMEEMASVYACGAGSISKLVTNGAIHRHASVKDVKLYLNEFDTRLNSKLAFLCEK